MGRENDRTDVLSGGVPALAASMFGSRARAGGSPLLAAPHRVARLADRRWRVMTDQGITLEHGQVSGGFSSSPMVQEQEIP